MEKARPEMFKVMEQASAIVRHDLIFKLATVIDSTKQVDQAQQWLQRSASEPRSKIWQFFDSVLGCEMSQKVQKEIVEQAKQAIRDRQARRPGVPAQTRQPDIGAQGPKRMLDYE